MILKTTALVLSALLMCTSAFASQPTTPAQANGQQNSDNFVANLKKVKSLDTMATYMQFALNAIVAEGVSELRAAGLENDARQFEVEWAQQFSASLYTNRDLGDHTPLNEWLGYFYKNLEMNLGIEKMKATRLYDLKVYNFGIPVVMHPQGNAVTQEEWDKAEYQLHFVPVFASTTYWGSLAACMFASTKVEQLKPFCKTISKFAEKFVSSGIAANVSDMVYDRANAAKQ